MSSATSEVRYAFRGLVRTPTIAICAVVCLALGIGATTSIASAVRRALLQPSPFHDQDALVAVHRVTPQSGPQGTWPNSAPNYVDIANGAKRLQSLAAMTPGAALITSADDAVQAQQIYVTGNFFSTLGVNAQLGRLLQPSDEHDDQPQVVVLSAEFWRSRYGADRNIVGRTIQVDGQPTTVVGVAPADLRIPHGPNVFRTDIWSPLRFTPGNLQARRSNYLFLLGRLAPGASVAIADAEARTLFTGIVADHPELRGEGIRVAALRAENMASIRTPLLLLFGAVCLVLLIASTNVAALLLARGVQRRREMAVRTALGATRWDTMRLALTESAIITIIGTILGVALAVAGVRTIGGLAAARLPQLDGLSVDTNVVLFAIALAIVVSLLCGAAPAWKSGSVDPQDALRGTQGAGTGRAHHRALKALVLTEIATSLVLVIGAGLVLKAFAQLLNADAGFDPSHIVTVRTTTSPAQYADRSSVGAFLDPTLEKIRAIPGVEAAAAISSVPYAEWGNNGNVRYEGMPKDDPTKLPLVEQRRITPDFFNVTRQRLLAGRTLLASDNAQTPAVVVVNQALVDRDFKGQDVVGKRFHLTDTTFGTIVGVVSNIKNNGPVSPPMAEMYWSYSQASPNAASFSVMIRTRSDQPSSVVPQVREMIRSVDPTAAVSGVATMNEIITRSLGSPRFYFSLLGTFAAVAIVLAVAGLYGVLSYAVAQRTREFGIRLALGSSTSTLLRLVTAQGMRLVAGGLLVGLVGSALVTRLMTAMLYGVSPLDRLTWAAACLLLMTAGMLAVLVPAFRATRVNPIRAIAAD